MAINIFYYLEDNSQSTIKQDFDKTLHRLDGPAIEYSDGSKCWFQDGKYHRIDGPAIEWADGIKYWWYKGEYLKHITSQKQYEQWLKLKAFW